MIVAVLWWVAQVVGVGMIAWLVWWLIGYLALPEPFAKVARIGVAVGAVALLIWMVFRLFQILGHPIA